MKTTTRRRLRTDCKPRVSLSAPLQGPRRGAAVAKQHPDPAVEVAAVKAQDEAGAAAQAGSDGT